MELTRLEVHVPWKEKFPKQSTAAARGTSPLLRRLLFTRANFFSDTVTEIESPRRRGTMKRLATTILLLASLAVGNFFLSKTQPAVEETNSRETSSNAELPTISTPDESPPKPSPAEIRRLIARTEADGYRVRGQERSLHASNGRQEFSAQWSLDEGQLRIESLDPWETWHFAMRTPGAVQDSEIAENKLTIKRATMDEWFINDARGIEHGFDVAEPPARSGDEGFSVSMEIITSLKPRLHEDERSITFHGSDGEDALHYRGLVVFDADGDRLPASLEIKANDLSTSSWAMAIHVDDRDARYPLIIDPLLTTNTNSLISQPATEGDRFGQDVSISGNMMAIGVRGADEAISGGGAVALYRFDEVAQSWEFLKRVFAETPVENGQFGFSVDLNGDLLIVGAAFENTNTGAAYIFERDAGGPDNWGQVTRLESDNPAFIASFGFSVAIESGIAAIGSSGKSAFAGALYASFRSPAGDWSPAAEVTGFEPVAGDRYGAAVDVDSGRIIASAVEGQTGASPIDCGVVVIHEYIFDENGLPVSHSTEVLTDNNPASLAYFGRSLDLEGDILIVGSPGSLTDAGPDSGTVEVFRNDPMSGWGWIAELQAEDKQAGVNFGHDVGLSGRSLVVGAPYHDRGTKVNSGAAYLFEIVPGSLLTWQFIERILYHQSQLEGRYGERIAMSGDKIAIGAPSWDLAGGRTGAGVVETLVRRSERWTPTSLPNPGFAGNLERGYCVAIDKNRAIVGSPGDFNERGRVQLLARAANEHWQSEGSVVNPIPQEGERFGHSIALAGTWMVIGAPGHDEAGMEDVGRVSLFHKGNGLGWHFVKSLDAPGLTAGAEYGMAVAMTSHWAFVGAPGMSHGYIFERNKGGINSWSLATTIDESAAGGRFGSAVTSDGDHAAFSAPEREGIAPPGEMPATVPAAGQVIIYESSLVGGEIVWLPKKTLPSPAPDGSFGSPNARLGSSLALHHGVLLAGAPGYLNETGRVKAFGVNRGGLENWGELQTLTSASASPGDQFGSSLGIGQRWFFVGAPGQYQGGIETGAVHVFDRNKITLPVALPADSVILHPRSQEDDKFGAALGFSANQLLVGLPGRKGTTGFADSGTTAIFHRQSSGWAPLGGAAGANALGGDQLGFSSAIHGDFLLAGAPFDTVNGNASAGSVHLYRRNPAASNGWSFVKYLIPSDVQIGANFGFAVDIFGDTAVIGAPGWNNKGTAYLFERNFGGADNWGQRKRIVTLAVGAGDDFGTSVALHEDLLVVGSPKDDFGGATDSGSAFVFERHSGGSSNWGPVDTIRKETPVAFDFFGVAVDIDKGRIVIGSSLSDEAGNASGAAYLYHRIGPGNFWTLANTMANSGVDDRLGTAVAIDGDFIALGATGEDTFGLNSGAVWIYQDLNSDGTLVSIDEKITIGDFEDSAILPGLEFGKSVAIRSGQVVVGAPGFDSSTDLNTGAAYLFERNHGTRSEWGLVKRLLGAASGITGQMGRSVTMSDDTIVAGAPGADQGGGQDDAGYLFFFGDISSVNLDWTRLHFGKTNVADASLKATLWGPLADPDNDGRVNALEAFMATDPQAVEPDGEVFGVSRRTGEDLVFTYRQGKETNGALGRVKWSRDLLEWRGGEIDDDEIQIALRVVENHADYFMMEARISADQLIGEPRLMMRLEVNVP